MQLAWRRFRVKCKDHKVGLKVYRWKGNEDDRFYMFPTKALLAIHGLSLHHWNRNDISKLMTKPAHLIDISKETSTKSCKDYARVLVGCENLSVIPHEFNAVIGEQLFAIKIEVKCSWGVSRDVALLTTRKGLDASVTSVSVREAGTSGADLVGTSDRLFTRVVLHPTENWRSYIWKNWKVKAYQSVGVRRNSSRWARFLK